MKKILTAAIALSTLILPRTAASQEFAELSQPPNGRNQRAEVSQWIGLVRITIAYHSPRVHARGGADRTGRIWGVMLPYGLFDEGFGPSKATPWRAGANESTTITFSHDVKVESKDLKAGTYALFLELRESGPWYWIFSGKSAGWGSFQYDPKDEVLRVPVSPQDAPQTEFLTYGFDERLPGSALGFVQWDNKRVLFKVEVPNVDELSVAKMRNDLQGWAGFSYQNWQIAAQFCADHKVNLEEALIWADKAIKEPFRAAAEGREDYSTLQTRANVLRALGRADEGDAVTDQAVHLKGTPVTFIHQRGRALLAAKQADKALAVFKYNRQQHPDDKFTTYLGLALGYTAVGDKKNAIANWELALMNVPDSQKANLPGFQKSLEALKQGR